MARIPVTGSIGIDDSELEESFIRASGPGGQNVNKVASAVQLRFDLKGSPSLPAGLKARGARLGRRWLTQEGVLVITAARHRTQEMNRADARERLIGLLREAAVPPTPRRATQPTRASVERRLKAKSAQSTTKALRGRTPRVDDDTE